MALTLTEGNKYSTTELAGYVIDRLAKPSEVLTHLKFVDIEGNSWTYNTTTTRSGAAFYDPNDTWVESTHEVTAATAVLRILGGDADVDNFILTTRSNKLDVQGEVLDDKVKAVRETFLDSFYYGDNSSNAKQFSGLQKLMTSTTYNTVHAGSGTGTALSILKLQEAIDLITGWESTHLLMTKMMRRYINVYLDSIGDKFTSLPDPKGFGGMVEYFRGHKVTVDDCLLNTETAASGAYSAKTGGGNTTIFVATWDPKAICGLQSGAGITTVPLGDLETKDAQRWRIRWYCSMKFEDLRSAAKVDGIDADGTVTA